MKKLFTLVMMLACAGMMMTSCIKEEENPQDNTSPNLIAGRFSVSDSKTVQFAKGNLYWNGSEMKLEANQYDYPTSWDANHVGHFFWTTNAETSYADTYTMDNINVNDLFWCGESNKITVDGTDGFYVLSDDEWNYLFNERQDAEKLFTNGVNVAGVPNCIIVAPDGYDYTSNPLRSKYSAEEWAEAETLGLVCLPSCGFRKGTNFDDAGLYGYYWSATPHADVEDFAHLFTFYAAGYVSPSDFDNRFLGSSLRLVK